jgi:hypothetical protein
MNHERETMAAMTYRTQDDRADYGSSSEFQSDTGWRVCILLQSLHGNLQQLLHQSMAATPYERTSNVFRIILMKLYRSST